MPRTDDKIGPYTLIRKLGSGAFGVVWLAERRGALATTEVALKLAIDDDPDLEAVKQESKLWAHVGRHPNVLPIIEADIYDNQIVIVSEYAPDGSLDGWLKKHGNAAPSLEAALTMTTGILAGLEHLHSRRVIHRDLKPANILLQGDTPRLADFGLSRVLKTSANTATAAGTPAFMSPEAFSGERSEQSDIWSAGIMLYYMICGRVPFPQTDLIALIGAIATKDPEPLPGTPKAVQNIVLRALQKDPRARYQSALEMRKEIQQYLAKLTSKADNKTDEEADKPTKKSLKKITSEVEDATPTLKAKSRKATDQQRSTVKRSNSGTKDPNRIDIIDNSSYFKEKPDDTAPNIITDTDNPVKPVETKNQLNKPVIKFEKQQDRFEDRGKDRKIEPPPFLKDAGDNIPTAAVAPEDNSKKIAGYIALLLMAIIPIMIIKSCITNISTSTSSISNDDKKISKPVDKTDSTGDNRTPPAPTLGPYNAQKPQTNSQFSIDEDYPYPEETYGIVYPQLLTQISAKYTEAARANRIQGSVTLAFVVHKDGRVSDIKVVQGLGYGLNEEAIKALNNAKFSPAQLNGRAVTAKDHLEIAFFLN